MAADDNQLGCSRLVGRNELEVFIGTAEVPPPEKTPAAIASTARA